MIKRKNPKDEEFLKKVKIIKKKFRVRDNTEDLYQAKYNNMIIAEALYDPHSKTIESISVQNFFQRKGLATLLYDYIEKDLIIKLTPNSTRTWHGKAFWEDRLKRKNPTDKELLKEIEIRKIKTFEQIKYKIYHLNKFIGYADYEEGSDCINFILIARDEYQRKGLASFLYDYIEKDQKIKLKPSHCLWPDGEAFWKNRSKKNPKRK